MMPKGLIEYKKMYEAEKKAHPELPAWAIKTIVKEHMKKARR